MDCLITKQIFRVKPDMKILMSLINCFDISDLNESKQFTKHDIRKFNTIEKINEIIPDLMIYYYPHKIRMHLSHVTERNCITILSHFLAEFNYKLNRREAVTNQKKLIYYNIISQDPLEKKIKINNKGVMVTFT